MNNSDFDRLFEQNMRNIQKVHRNVTVAFPIIALLGLGFAGTVIYLAVHFLSKIW